MEKERLEKVKKAIDIGVKLSYALGELDCSVKGSPKYGDLFFISSLLNEEWSSLWADLYPEDLMEDVKKRQEAMKLAKGGTDNRVPLLTFKQKVGLFFRRNFLFRRN